jgi:DNA-directed RNA polymerase subunit M/transcription elongation factor TFIIS
MSVEKKKKLPPSEKKMSKRGWAETFGVPKVHNIAKTDAEKQYFETCRKQRETNRLTYARILERHQNVGSIFKCNQCHSDAHVRFDTKVKRAWDEGMIYECICTKCGFTFTL